MRIPDGFFVRTLTQAECPEQAALDALPEGERVRAARFTHARRRRQFVLGRQALRQLAAPHLAMAPADVPLTVAPDGALELAGGGWHASLAHSDDRALAGISRAGPVGVDLERIRPRHPGVAGFMLHPDERPRFEALPLAPDAAVILFWTVKEAVLKGLRTGLRLSPKHLQVDADLERGRALIRVSEQQSWEARFEEQDGFYLAVAFPQRADAG